jgi:predicted GNAT superfamily acetyltransferase
MPSEAWELAYASARRAGVEIRPLTELEDATAVNEVIRQTWGDSSLIAPEFLRAFQASGNWPIGAIAQGRVVGFALGFLGPGDGIHVHSHMLAVLPELRTAGIGYALKLAQRAWALDAGINVLRWTFDPLQAKNAHFNLRKLGAVADRFFRHFYGDMADDLNRGDRSDRLEVRWDVREDVEREAAESGGAGETPWVVLSREPAEPAPRPSEVRPPRGDPHAIVEIPTDYGALRRDHPDLALRWREAAGDALEACFAAGMTAVGFLPEAAYVFAVRPVS